MRWSDYDIGMWDSINAEELFQLLQVETSNGVEWCPNDNQLYELSRSYTRQPFACKAKARLKLSKIHQCLSLSSCLWPMSACMAWEIFRRGFHIKNSGNTYQSVVNVEAIARLPQGLH
eukprot:scaffold270023_cov23-Prasinocladus_malaysianus.AAC.1